MKKFLNWLRNPCRLGHHWIKRNGTPVTITARERMAHDDGVLFKDPRHGWLRYERVCDRCLHRQFLRVTNPNQQEAEWHDV